MKSGWFLRPSTGTLLNKPLLILFVVIISSSSFLLGYMAGKSNVESAGKEIIAMRSDDSSSEAATIEFSGEEGEDAPPVTPADAQNYDRNEELPRNKKMTGNQDDPVKIERISESPQRIFAETRKGPGEGEYTVQTGAFKTMKDASALKSSLHKKGYNSYIVTTRAGGISLYKVRVGSFDIKSDAEKIVLSLKQKESIDAFVVKKR